MPASSEKQANAARLAGAVKKGKFPPSKAGKSIRNMAKMSMKKLKHFMKTEGLSIEEKKKLLYGFKLLKHKLQQENAMTLSPQEPMWISEESPNSERKVIAQTFSTKGNLESILLKNRGVQFSPKEIDAILGFEKVTTPSRKDKFSVTFELTDDFGNNTKTVVKKHKQDASGTKYVFTAYSTHNTAELEPKKPEPPKQPKSPQPSPMGKAKSPPSPQPPKTSLASKASAPPQSPPRSIKEENDRGNIIITKTIAFSNEIEGADVLSDFLRTLKL